MIRLNFNNGCFIFLILILFFVIFLLLKFWYIVLFIILLLPIIEVIRQIRENKNSLNLEQEYSPKIGEVYKLCPYCSKKIRRKDKICPYCNKKLN